jgi:thiol-disulfide isomerase/thioredoxin
MLFFSLTSGKDMLRKTFVLWPRVLTIAFLTGCFLFYPIPTSWTQSDCPSCNSFGVQRFPEKKEAPPFTLKSLDGNSVTLSQFKGKPLLLFFWGTWCEACKEDIVLLEKFAEQAKDCVTVVTVVVDGERDKRARQIVSKLKVTLPVLLLLKENVIDTYEIRMIPMAVLVDQGGSILGRIVGQRDWSGPVAWSVTKELLKLN